MDVSCDGRMSPTYFGDSLTFTTSKSSISFSLWMHNEFVTDMYGPVMMKEEL